MCQIPQQTPPIEQMIEQKDWNSRVAKAIMECESRGKPKEVNDNPATGDYSVGLFQVNLYGELSENRPSEEWLKNPKNNIDYAHKLYKQGSWTHWRNCAEQVGVL